MITAHLVIVAAERAVVPVDQVDMVAAEPRVEDKELERGMRRHAIVGGRGLAQESDMLCLEATGICNTTHGPQVRGGEMLGTAEPSGPMWGRLCWERQSLDSP